MSYLPAIFSLIAAAAGWFYMFYSRAALKLAGVEPPETNRRRVRLRRACGFVMILLAAAFYVGCVALDREQWTAAMFYMIAVVACMIAIIVLAQIDLRMTRELRRRQTQVDPPDSQQDHP